MKRKFLKLGTRMKSNMYAIASVSLACHVKFPYFIMRFTKLLNDNGVQIKL